MNIVLLMLSLLVPAAVVADESERSQWAPVNASLFDLVQAGSRIVAVTEHERRDAVVVTYYLQSDRTVHSCAELRAADAASKAQPSLPKCWRLVRPPLAARQ